MTLLIISILIIVLCVLGFKCVLRLISDNVKELIRNFEDKQKKERDNHYMNIEALLYTTQNVFDRLENINKELEEYFINKCRECEHRK